MPDDFVYFTARDWLGCPISKSEMDSMTYNRKLYEKRAIYYEANAHRAPQQATFFAGNQREVFV